MPLDAGYGVVIGMLDHYRRDLISVETPVV